MAVSFFTARFLKKEQVSSDAWSFYFKRSSSFEYKAGQYIKVWMDIENPDDRGITRYFTLSSSPTEDHLMITTRILKSSFKMALGNLEIGSMVKMRGPWGDFVLSESNKRPIVFISGGIGITPFRSMIKNVADSNLKIPITLFASYKTPDQILYKNELEDITSKNNNIKVVTVLTEDKEKRMNSEFLQKHLDSLDKYLYYVAGSDRMVEGVKKMLLRLKIKKEMILEDSFPGYK